MRSLDPAADLFQEGWSRVRGRAGGSAGPAASLGRASQMVRAAQGYRPAVFKAIRKGGCHSGAQLARQLAYLTSKSSHVFDAFGVYDGQSVLTPAQREELVARFERTWDPARQPKLGHTSHLLMSFPVGTKAAAVREVARAVCEQFFQGDGALFDYLVAVHEDRAHTHAHVVVNRHSPDGEMFYLRSGHHHSYELFREAMVEHGDHHGLRLEATRRIDRGLTTFDARSVEVQHAHEAGHDPEPRERAGRDRERALRHIQIASSTYRGLAAAASLEGFAQVSEALMRASLALARSGAVLPTREITMMSTQGSFDGLVREFARNVQALEDRIAAVPPVERPRLEQGLTEALITVAALNPLGEDSATLTESASADGVYSRARIARDALARLDDPRVRSVVDAALRGTGLDAGEILARLRIGADNAALESHWHARDVRAVAASLGTDAAGSDVHNRALDRLEAAYDRIEGALREVGVLREDRALADEREEGDRPRATHAPMRADEWAASDPSARDRLPALAERLREPGPAAVEAGEATSEEEAEDEWRLLAIATRLRDAAPTATAFADEAEARAFRASLERRLGEGELARLRRGEEAVLDRVAEDRLDRLALAKAYLEGDPATRGSAVQRMVMKQIVHEQVERQAAKEEHEEEGPTHD